MILRYDSVWRYVCRWQWPKVKGQLPKGCPVLCSVGVRSPKGCPVCPTYGCAQAKPRPMLLGPAAPAASTSTSTPQGTLNPEDGKHLGCHRCCGGLWWIIWLPILGHGCCELKKLFGKIHFVIEKSKLVGFLAPPILEPQSKCQELQL